MTSFEPTLQIKRLIVYSKGRVAYDQSFHSGVNIIRGENSSGKSTIANFIFFVLGGDFSKFTIEALKCDSVLCEVVINGATYTLRREISPNALQSMDIFWGDLEKAEASAAAGWERYPFKRSANRSSFSQTLFEILKFPEITVEGSNITMHQLLRLIYIDQVSSFESLMRNEGFDLQIKRETVGDLLFGIYDNSIYGNELEIKKVEKDLEKVKQKITSYVEILGQTGEALDVSLIEKEIQEVHEQILRVNQALANEEYLEGKAKGNLEYDNLRQELHAAKNYLSDVSSNSASLELEIADSRLFIQSLERRIEALVQAIETHEGLGELPLLHCPQCLSPLHFQTKQGHCSLCQNELPADGQQ